MESVGEYEYNTKDLIGHGAFAVVFKGRSKKNYNFVVAIKSITKKNLSKSQNLLGKEIKILKELTELHHENVVALLDCKETPHHVYLVMEYCNGGDLADYLQIKGTLSEDTIRLFLRQLAGAMRALNAKGIVHRDLKPQNILLCHSGKPNPAPNEIRLKIADFGFARFLQDGVMAATLCGSPMYMAPEVIMSLQYDAKADLWSIGTIVFQCLTGKAPFQAQTPQALKQFYEKNVNLSPKIPHGTSNELGDLLMRLLKRNARDRLEFDDFFSHPFLKKMVKPTSPVPVPARQRSHSHDVSPVKLLAESPLSGIVPASAPDNFEDLPQEVLSSANLASSHSSVERLSPVVKGHISPVTEEQDDFVVVSTNLQSHISYENVAGVTNKRKSSDPYGSPLWTGGTPPTKFSTVGINSLGDVNMHHGKRYSPPARDSLPPRPTDLPVPNSPSSGSGVTLKSEPIPVPTQKEAYQQIQQSLRESPGSPVHLPIAEDSNFNKEVNMLPMSPASPSRSPKYWENMPSNVPSSQPVAIRRDSMENLSRMTPDISSISPPSVQFLIGTPPAVGHRSGSTTNTPPPGNPWSSPLHHLVSGQQRTSTSPLNRTSLNSPPLNGNFCFNSGALPTILKPTISQPTPLINCNNLFPNLTTASDGNNSITSPSQPLVVPFGTRAHTLPELNSKDPFFDTDLRDPRNNDAAMLGRSGSTGMLNDTSGSPDGAFGMSPKGIADENASYNSVLPYGRTSYVFGHESPSSSPYKSPFSKAMIKASSGSGNHHLHFGTSPPTMDGPIFFVAPELPQETLMEREHNETLAKLNFVSALVDCIIDLAKTRSMPIAALTDSIMYKENNPPDQLQCVVSEGYKRAEQLVLYIRALQMLSSSLNMSREELKTGRLQPSNLVKNVVSNMNEKYHFCLEMCKSLNSQNLLHSVKSDPQTSSITAEKLLYNYAIEMCQSAALDELFGNPQECFQRYQTAQILLHSLGQQISNDDDRHLLNKYKEAVEKRLFVLQQQGYIYAYDTSCTS